MSIAFHNQGAHMRNAIAVAIAVSLMLACAEAQGPTELASPTWGVLGDRSMGPLTDTVLGTMTEIEQPLKVLVVDHNGVPIPGVVVTWTASGGGSVSHSTTVTDAGGEAFVEYTFGREARSGYGATASVPGLSGSPIVWELRAHPGRPVAIERAGGQGLTVPAGEKVVYSLRVRDSYGNGTHGVWIDWAIASGGGSLSWSRNVTGDNGHAEATRTLGVNPGEQTAIASAPDLPGAPRITFTTTANPR